MKNTEGNISVHVSLFYNSAVTEELDRAGFEINSIKTMESSMKKYTAGII